MCWISWAGVSCKRDGLRKMDDGYCRGVAALGEGGGAVDPQGDA